jgi:ferredoxin
MSRDGLQEIEDKIADLKARWPAHSVSPSMWLRLEELERELEDAKKGCGDCVRACPSKAIAITVM